MFNVRLSKYLWKWYECTYWISFPLFQNALRARTRSSDTMDGITIWLIPNGDQLVSFLFVHSFVIHLFVPSGIIFPLTMGCIPMLLSTCIRVFFYFILICPLNNVPFSFSLPKLFVYSPRLPLFLHFAFNFLRPTVFFRALKDEPRISYTTRWFRQRHLVKKIWLASPIHLPVGFEYHEFWVEAVEGWV